MNNIKRINTSYFAVSSNANAGDFSVMKPVPGDKGALKFGCTQAGLAWFFSIENGLFVYDISSLSLKYKIQLPAATQKDRQTQQVTDDFDGRNYEVLVSPDQTQLYHFTGHCGGNREIRIIDIQDGSIVKEIQSLPGGFQTYGNCRLDKQGNVLFEATRFDGKVLYGLVRVDIQSGEYETSICESSSASGQLHSPSPDGKYWLRSDNSRIAYVAGEQERKPLFGFRGEKTESKEFFSFVIEVWESFPLRCVARVAPMWMSPHELPDNGHLDGNIYFVKKDERGGLDISAWVEGKTAKRAKIFRDLAKYLKKNPTENWRLLTFFRAGETDWLWADERTFFKNISSNLSDFEFSENDVVGWAPDGGAFWVKRNSFVSCVGVDGTVSPKIKFERYGMRDGTWLPCAASFRAANPQGERRLQVTYPDGTVIADGSAEAPTTKVRTIALDEDCYAELSVDPTIDKEKKLAEKAETIAQKLSIYRIPLASMDDVDCVSAIKALTDEISADINERVHDNQLRALFVFGRKQINEENFFSHVEKNCISAAPALRSLVAAICEHVSGYELGYYEPYPDDTAYSIGAFGHAVRCLAKLDPDSNDVLLKYGMLIDTFHEDFYLHEIFPLMLENESDANRRLLMAEDVLLASLGNAFDPGPFWLTMQMGKTASSMFSPDAYAERIYQRALDINAQDLGTNLLGPVLNRLSEQLQEKANDWELSMIHELKTMAG